MKLLHVDSSIQGEASASRAVSAAVTRAIRDENPSIEVEYRDLAAEPLEHMTLASFGTPESQAALEQFKQADIVVIGAAFYNFTVSSQLKSWIDRLAVAGHTFRYGPNGAEGLMGGKRVIVALSRGGIYAEGTPQRAAEHGETWLRSIFAFFGIDDVEFVIAEGLALGEEPRKAAIAKALEDASQAAGRTLAKAA